MSELLNSDRLRVRPYALTGGRVRSATELALETIVIMTARGVEEVDQLDSERRDIGRLCIEPISIVEISAKLNLPLGVVRVLVGDMVTEGLLNTHRLEGCSAGPGGRPDQRLLERVLHGLQAI